MDPVDEEPRTVVRVLRSVSSPSEGSDAIRNDRPNTGSRCASRVHSHVDCSRAKCAGNRVRRRRSSTPAPRAAGIEDDLGRLMRTIRRKGFRGCWSWNQSGADGDVYSIDTGDESRDQPAPEWRSDDGEHPAIGQQDRKRDAPSNDTR